MQNELNYYYGLYPSLVRQIKNNYYFTLNDKTYMVRQIKKEEVESSFALGRELYEKKVIDTIIYPTLLNELSFSFHDKTYVLLSYKKCDKKIEIQDILDFKKKTIPLLHIKNTSDWGTLWSLKADFFEYQMSKLGVKYEIIKDSFSYYIGLLEAGIALFNQYKKESILVLSHKRVDSKMSVDSLEDPFNIILDYPVRDICEYMKCEYVLTGDIPNLEEYILSLTKEDAIMFFIRMFYPTFYFDVFERVLQEEASPDNLRKIVKKTKEYHLLLKRIYHILLKRVELPVIAWLI